MRFTQSDLVVIPGRRPRHHPEAKVSEPGPRSLQTSQGPRASECGRDPAKCPKGAVHVRPGAVCLRVRPRGAARGHADVVPPVCPAAEALCVPGELESGCRA